MVQSGMILQGAWENTAAMPTLQAAFLKAVRQTGRFEAPPTDGGACSECHTSL